MILEKMNLEEVINPHYAFPIAGVLLCALLVFAFGFKTPVQPPSFDFEEQRRATGRKKQKSKEKPKVVQNGSTPHVKVVTTVKTSEPEQPATPPVTPPKSEKHSTKSDAKTKVKKSAADAANQQASQPEVKKQVASEDTNGGQWTQQLSKKDRKNRKKEEPQDAEKSPKKKNKGEDLSSKVKGKQVKEPVTTAEEPSKNEAPPVAETKTEAPAPKEQREPKKKAAKVIEEKANPEPPSAVKAEPAKGKGKKDKKSEEVKVVEPPTEPKPAVAAPPVATDKSKPAEEGKTDDSGSTNVAFDELGDMWQDTKPQKKKKKARRE